MVLPCKLNGLFIVGIMSSTALEIKQKAPSPHLPQAQWFPTVQHRLTPKAKTFSFPTSPSLYDPDLTELILLAGNSYHGTALNEKTIKRIGWKPGIRIKDATLKHMCYFDHAWTFKKGTHCIAAFAGDDDPEDNIELFTGVNGPEMNVTNVCGFSVHAGIAKELITYQQSPNWTAFIEYFAQPECEMVTSVGHSWGGGVASIFAACTNVGQDGFGKRKDFGLVTFGTPPVGAEPFYSGTPGTPFRGTRYHITGYDEGYDARLTLPEETRMFRLDIVRLYKKVADVLNLENASTQLRDVEAILSYLPEMAVEPYWTNSNIIHTLLPMWPVIRQIWTGGATHRKLLALQPFVREMMRNCTNRNEISYVFDPFSVIFATYGYKHPLVDYQAIASKMIKDVPLRRIPAPWSADFPRHDPFLASIGTMLTGKSPNHAPCCYYRGENCINNFEMDYYTQDFIACPVNIFR